ncbi:hypothetical protein M6B38_160935 [Iris pallida]|uniref:Secreted protein n=1 Tax=Iris pallida TaxID=29817 RepID=A0AAX6ER11_IRIPA|nr:hypothetical protein M6B38_175710 [Iris pallida]KAJ6809819.1 hypothetical protein M6B38_160935 [Iris pallida]
MAVAALRPAVSYVFCSRCVSSVAEALLDGARAAGSSSKPVVALIRRESLATVANCNPGAPPSLFLCSPLQQATGRLALAAM